MRKLTFLLLILYFAATSIALAREDLRLEASLERNKVSVGNPVYLTITFYGDNNVKISQAPQAEGLRINYVGPASRTSIVNGEVSKSVAHAYLIYPLKAGNFEIGPFYADRNGGYTRILKLAKPRLGDNGRQAIFELVGFSAAAESDDSK